MSSPMTDSAADKLRRCVCLSVALLLSACTAQPTGNEKAVVISIIGTNDVHGELLPKADRGGLVTISAYIDALRSVRTEGAVLLIDAGDMWQGTLESNLNEGAVLVEAYNAMGYVAAAIGNHEFDFGPVGPDATPTHDADARGALKQRAAEAHFPLLAANLIDESTGETVDWPNVQPSIMIEAAGINVGIVGVLSKNALRATIAANVVGLQIAPLAESIQREAEKLRAAGADLVIVTAHAGGRCHDFSNPTDVTSCEMNGEIMNVANALPQRLVDHIIGGHVHDGIAHIFNGIAVTSGHSKTYAFSRVDFTVNAADGEILSRQVYPPQLACPYRNRTNGLCIWLPSAVDSDSRPAVYEGQSIAVNNEVLAIALRAQSLAREQKQQKLGAYLETPFTLKGNPESALANLLTEVMLQSIDGDIAIHNVSGGIRAPLPAGELTFGSVYEMFPFDNRVVVLKLSGSDLRRVIAAQVRRSRRRAGFSGMHVSVNCDNDVMSIEMKRTDGSTIEDSDSVRVVANDYLALGGDAILSPAMPANGFSFDSDLPMTRDVIVDWLRDRGVLRAEDFLSGERPKWRAPAEVPDTCKLDT